ncbi:GNAT family N-acetyltransferase [Aminipila terrae]|uniref:GNAT family N-acetyltransferase n=1 Tax=Aminipila terrae TaxID=2697030 RepID=A0A6P1MLS5_9FIRM|nr:GNAT family N-acetyltransferase [Aminipila terrae]QHI73624.1 GNAT family N-acetyltransferase [Aminipila terrae]
MNQLKYQPLHESHANDLLAIWSDEDVIRYTNIKEPCSLQEINERIQILKSFDVFIVSNGDGVIGIIGCPCVDKEKGQYGVFYQFRKSSWGQGYATMATDWLLNYMRNKYNDVTFFADVVTDNVASEKILKHFGFNYISEEDGFERNGIKMKIHNYRLCY